MTMGYLEASPGTANGSSTNKNNNSQILCHFCGKAIQDKFVTTVLDRSWHAECVKCSECGVQLDQKCFAREGKIFCKQDFYW